MSFVRKRYFLEGGGGGFVGYRVVGWGLMSGLCFILFLMLSVNILKHYITYVWSNGLNCLYMQIQQVIFYRHFTSTTKVCTISIPMSNIIKNIKHSALTERIFLKRLLQNKEFFHFSKHTNTYKNKPETCVSYLNSKM